MNVFNDPMPRAYCQFTFGATENGFILGDYDIGTDEYKLHVAKNAAEFKSLLLKWQSERIHGIVEWAEKKQAAFKE